MDERAKELIMNLVELMRESQQRVYDYEFADYLMSKTGIKPEELVECGIYGSRPLHPDVGGIAQREDGSIIQVFREHYGEGDIFKSWRRFYLGALDEICYVPEGSDSGYSRESFLDLCDGDNELAERLFEAATWEHPESWIDQAITSGEWIVCDGCGKLYDADGNSGVCPECGKEEKV